MTLTPLAHRRAASFPTLDLCSDLGDGRWFLNGLRLETTCARRRLLL